jgi:hypothetical protein
VTVRGWGRRAVRSAPWARAARTRATVFQPAALSRLSTLGERLPQLSTSSCVSQFTMMPRREPGAAASQELDSSRTHGHRTCRTGPASP